MGPRHVLVLGEWQGDECRDSFALHSAFTLWDVKPGLLEIGLTISQVSLFLHQFSLS